MRRSLALAFLVLLACSIGLPARTGVAQEPADAEAQPSPPEASPEERLEALVADHTRKMEDFQKGFAGLETDEQRRAHYDENFPDPAETAIALLDLADEHPDAVGFEVVEWVFGQRVQGAARARAVAFMGDHLAGDSRIRPLLWNFAYDFDLATEQFLGSIIEKGDDPESRGIARYVLAKSLVSRIDFAGYLATASEEDLGRMTEYFGEETIAALRSVDAETLEERAASLLETVQEQHADVKSLRGKSLGELAARDLFEMRNLAVGKTAPEIEGQDLFGTAFKLSDYRGKVIFLDFWGDW